MADRFDVEFGSQRAANQFRDEFDDYLEGDQDRRTTDVGLSPDAPDDVIEQASGRAAVAQDERATGFEGVALSESEKKQIDFTETSVVEARQAKAKAAEKGVGDFVSAFDQTLTVEENEEIFERAARDTSGGRDAQRSVQERHADAFRTSESEMLEHARQGVKAGSKQAEKELRRRGVSEQEINRLKRQSPGRIDARTKVLFPDVGEVTPRKWAEAKRSHEHRRVEAQLSDENKRNQSLTTDVDEWREAPGQHDFPGVDTKRGVGSWLSGEKKEEFTELTDELWPWQG